MTDERAATQRPARACPDCGATMEFKEGRQIHDLWSERYECPSCGKEVFHSYGRGSV
jgi:predicted RNA-binding Zn-ribbon protein involved in translation (DUF1610 family)